MKLELQNKQAVVVGLGDTGFACVRWLLGQGARVRAADSRSAPPHAARLCQEFPQVPLTTGPFQDATFAAADLIVLSPGVAQREPAIAAARQRGVPVVGDIELFAQTLNAWPKRPQVIAITGANGKSTVTELAGAMCRAAGVKTVVAGNIGLPVLDALPATPAEAPDVYVLELSSFQLETTYSLNADAATVLNLTEDHMDRYDGMADYAAAKARIFMGAAAQVLNRDDAWSMGMAQPGLRQVTFGLSPAPRPQDIGRASVAGEDWLVQGESPLVALRDLKIAGLHNAANAMAALALCQLIGLPLPPLLEALRQFAGLPHRVQWVDEIHQVSFYDDSKGTNVGATAAALAGLAKKAVLIAGGDGKGQDFSPLKDPVAQHARAVVLIGRDAPLIEAVLADSGVELLHAQTLEEAVPLAYRQAQPGDAVLLSPACASWDMFRNYAHRAEVFVATVAALHQQELSA